MEKNKTFALLAFLALFIISISFVNAVNNTEVLVVGEIYNSSQSAPNGIGSASVLVACGSSTNLTTSRSDGTYGVIFNSGLCVENGSVQVDVSKNGMIGSGNGTIHICKGNCSQYLISIININMNTAIIAPETAGGEFLGVQGGGGTGCVTQWTCTEWTTCVNDVQTRICSYSTDWCAPQNTKPNESQICITPVTETAPTLPETIPTPSINNPGLFGTITGAVTGALGTAGGIIVAIFFVLLIGGTIIVILIKRRKQVEVQ